MNVKCKALTPIFLGAEIFTPTSTQEKWLVENMTWLKKQIESGKRIFDIGNARALKNTSIYYNAEKEALKELGYVRKFSKWTAVEGKKYRLYEWVKG